MAGTDRWVIDMAELSTIVEMEELLAHGFQFAPPKVETELKAHIVRIVEAIDEREKPKVGSSNWVILIGLSD